MYKHISAGNKILKGILMILLILVSVILIVCISIYLDSTQIKVTSYEVKSHKIPQEFNGYRIVQLSDIHGGLNSRLIEKVKAQKPDIILITGDIVNNTPDNSVEVFEQIMSGLNSIPMYAVTGNHDKWDPEFDSYIQKWQKNYNIKYLENETIELGKGVYLSGISDPDVWGKGAEKITSGYRQEMDIKDGYNILMYHRADMLDGFINTPYDLIFSGHIHGGQWGLPFIGGFMSPDMRFFPKYSGGKFDRDKQTFIVSRGIGNPVRVPRIFNMPEIVVVKLLSD